MVREGMLLGAAGDGRVAAVAADDVARATAAILLDAELHEERAVITGSQALTLREIATRLGREMHRQLAYVDLPEDELVRRLAQLGVPAERAHMEFACHSERSAGGR